MFDVPTHWLFDEQFHCNISLSRTFFQYIHTNYHVQHQWNRTLFVLTRRHLHCSLCVLDVSLFACDWTGIILCWTTFFVYTQNEARQLHQGLDTRNLWHLVCMAISFVIYVWWQCNGDRVVDWIKIVSLLHFHSESDAFWMAFIQLLALCFHAVPIDEVLHSFHFIVERSSVHF